MSKWQISYSLSAQLFCGVLLSFVSAAAVFIIFFLLGNSILDQTVYGESFMNQMADRQFRNLQSYVSDENVTADNLYPLDIWCSRGDKVYLAVYLGNQIRYASPISSKGDLDPEEYDPDFENPDNEYRLVLSDGVKAKAFLYFYTGEAYYYWTIVIAGLAAFIVFFLCFISIVHRKMRYIKKLRLELDILAGGNLNYPVTVKGYDELSELAHGIDEMRKSIVTHQYAEEEMRAANSELVTAMSHDLRTPLTSLLAYLELVDRGKYEDDSQLSHFIGKSLEKTFQIKSMADKLFEYFLVYSTSWEMPIMESVNADELFQQLWGEYAFSLENNGFAVICKFNELNGSLHVNIDLLRRAFDNIYSNILKYAAADYPIEITYRKEGAYVLLIVSNYIPPQYEKKESTKIGLNTCEHTIQQHGGTFVAKEDENCFLVIITLPLTE